jgi:hypothetical protein
MQLRIDWEKPVIAENDVLRIQTADLNDFYIAAGDDAFAKNNLFFILLNSLHKYSASGENEKAAHLAFLLAYYLFIALTPPGSCELALYYIKLAISLNPLGEYSEWLAFIEKGN